MNRFKIEYSIPEKITELRRFHAYFHDKKFAHYVISGNWKAKMQRHLQMEKQNYYWQNARSANKYNTSSLLILNSMNFSISYFMH